MGHDLSLDRAAEKAAWKITSVGGTGSLRARMLQMGIVPGTIVKIVRRAPFADPIEIQIRDARLALRRDECRHIVVAAAE